MPHTFYLVGIRLAWYDVLKEKSMIQLNEEQRRELASPAPIAIDPLTQQTYVLVREDVYERIKHILDDDDARLMAPVLADLDPEDWEDASAYPERP